MVLLIAPVDFAILINLELCKLDCQLVVDLDFLKDLGVEQAGLLQLLLQVPVHFFLSLNRLLHGLRRFAHLATSLESSLVIFQVVRIVFLWKLLLQLGLV